MRPSIIRIITILIVSFLGFQIHHEKREKLIFNRRRKKKKKEKMKSIEADEIEGAEWGCFTLFDAV